MAVNTTAAAELLKEHFETPFEDLMDRSTFFYKRFSKESGVGKEAQWKVHYSGNSSAGSYSEDDTLPSAGQQSYDAAASPYRQNWVVVEVNGLTQAATKGAGGYMEALATETKEALEDLKDEINTQLLAQSKAASTDIDGLPQIIADTGTYAGIDRSSATWWKSYVLDNSGTDRALSLALMHSMMEEMFKPERNADITAIYASKKHFNDYGNLLQAFRRYTDPTTLDGGYKALEFDSIDLIAVPGLASGEIYFVSEKDWEYQILQNFQTAAKGTNKDSDRYMINHYSQLICKRPHRQGKITDLS